MLQLSADIETHQGRALHWRRAFLGFDDTSRALLLCFLPSILSFSFLFFLSFSLFNIELFGLQARIYLLLNYDES